MEVIKAELEHLEDVVRLFDGYRVFYNQSSDTEGEREFLQERFHKGDSVIFLAKDRDLSRANRFAGFTQLYPSFSSVSMKRVWILNDLFVEEAYRRQGVAKLLMKAVEDFARDTGAVRIAIATQTSNAVAQALYESSGYCKNEDFYHYILSF